MIKMVVAKKEEIVGRGETAGSAIKIKATEVK